MSNENETNDGVAHEESSNAASTSYDPNVVEAAAHLVGISTPADEHHSSAESSPRKGMSDDALLAMGVEPDGGPSTNLVLTFVGLVVLIVLVGLGTMQLYKAVNYAALDRANARVDARLGETREAAAAVIGAYERLEAETGAVSYRVPVEVGMDILLGDPSLLAEHPLAPAPVAVVPTEAPVDDSLEGSGEGSGSEVPTAVDGTAEVAEGNPTPDVPVEGDSAEPVNP